MIRPTMHNEHACRASSFWADSALPPTPSNSLVMSCRPRLGGHPVPVSSSRREGARQGSEDEDECDGPRPTVHAVQKISRANTGADREQPRFIQITRGRRLSSRAERRLKAGAGRGPRDGRRPPRRRFAGRRATPEANCHPRTATTVPGRPHL